MRTHDVFVSFRGKTLATTSLVFSLKLLVERALMPSKIIHISKKGETIAPELLQAIKGSHIFVVVFSKNYASSTRCLRELAHICNCIETPERRVLPIFYDVVGSVRCAKTKKDNEMMEGIQRWREALTRVANHSGWDIRNKYVIPSGFT
ncbi:unnamed protein product, partial [Sphenostylis stenocarpa]